MRLVLLIVANAIFVVIIHNLLRAGEAAQRTHTYSVLKQLETQGMINTNTFQLTSAPPGSFLLRMNPIRTFHSAAVLVCVFWAAGITIVFWLSASVSPRTGQADGTVGNQ